MDFATPLRTMQETLQIGLYCFQLYHSPYSRDLTLIPFRITGAPFLDNYYIAFYYGNAGINSTMGLAPKNLDASAATAKVVIGSA